MAWGSQQQRSSTFYGIEKDESRHKRPRALHSANGARLTFSEWEAAGAGNLPVVVLSQYVAASYLDSLLEHGGFGYLLKKRIADVAELNRTLVEVVGGGIAVDPEIISSLLQSRRSGIASLTPREKEVLELMAQGLSNNA